MWFQISSYFKFLFGSSNQHGIHSPFVYDLITKCFYDAKSYPEYKQIKNYRSQLLQNNTTLEIEDFGSGSRVFSSNKRPIKAIARNSGSTLKRSKLLFRLCRYFNFETGIELGTSLGISSHAVALGAPKIKLTSIEGCPNIASFTANNLKSNGISNVSILNDTFSRAIPKLNATTLDFVFFDGHHGKEATLQYFEALLPKAHNNTVFLFDDIRWSEDMFEAWQTISQHPEVTVSIDALKWGFVFFRREQPKQHFTIRV
ncbi:MAG: methyltransferase [Bacteroidetes bacterium MedPE-SWsnd-G2]|nr:MAG: methyltransferase [Bacteroidetes bacterium MedPE-SWsnd-G2]